MTQQRGRLATPTSADCSIGSGDDGREDNTLRGAAANDAAFATKRVA